MEEGKLEYEVIPDTPKKVMDIKTYSVKVICKNCGHKGDLTKIPTGKTLAMYQRENVVRCKNCEVRYTFECDC